MLGMIVENGTVSNIAVFETDSIMPSGWKTAPDGVAIGDIENGDGTFSKPAYQDPTLEQIEKAERAWRNSELRRADIEIFKINDVGGDESAWRTYRIALRDWPSDVNFPDSTNRPVSPA